MVGSGGSGGSRRWGHGVVGLRGGGVRGWWESRVVGSGMVRVKGVVGVKGGGGL